MEVVALGKAWTCGLTWGILAWVPYFIDMPFILEISLGLPVFIAGYLIIFLETFINQIPNWLTFCSTLPIGMALSWLIVKVYSLTIGFKDRDNRKREVT